MLFRVDHPPDIEARRIEKLVGVQFFQRGGVHQFRLHVAGDGDESRLLPCARPSVR